jgi:hypothetical protein
MGYKKAQNFMLIPNSLKWAKNVPQKVIGKKQLNKVQTPVN